MRLIVGFQVKDLSDLTDENKSDLNLPNKFFKSKLLVLFSGSIETKEILSNKTSQSTISAGSMFI